MMNVNNMNNQAQNIKKDINDELALIILKKLQGQLDLRTLLMLYHHEICRYIDMIQLTWNNELEHISLCNETRTFTENQGHRQTFLLKFGDKNLGILQYQTIYPLDPVEIALLHKFHQLLAGPLSNALVYQEAKSLAYRHHSTSMYNQLCFDHDLEAAIERASSLNDGLILLVFAIEPLQKVSFTQGQKVLLQMTHILLQYIEPVTSYHLDDNKFALLLQPIKPEHAAKIALDIEQRIEKETQLSQFNLRHLLGFAQYQFGDTSLSMLQRANKELHQQILRHKEL